MFLYRVTDNMADPRHKQYFECSACHHRFPDVEVFKPFFGLTPKYVNNLKETLEGVFTLFNDCTPERYEENGIVRFCPYCGAPFFRVIDIFSEWSRSYRFSGTDKWLNEEEFSEAIIPVESDCRREYLGWITERLKEMKVI